MGGQLEYQNMPSLRDIAHCCLHLLNNSNWKFHQVLEEWFPNPVPECYGTDWDAGCRNTDAGSIGLNADSQLWEIGTSETNHLIMELVCETRTSALDMLCKEGMAWCSSRPMHSLWSVYCVQYSVGPSHWRAHTGQCTLYRACIHKANLLKKLTLKLIYIQGACE